VEADSQAHAPASHGPGPAAPDGTDRLTEREPAPSFVRYKPVYRGPLDYLAFLARSLFAPWAPHFSEAKAAFQQKAPESKVVRLLEPALEACSSVRHVADLARATLALHHPGSSMYVDMFIDFIHTSTDPLGANFRGRVAKKALELATSVDDIALLAEEARRYNPHDYPNPMPRGYNTYHRYHQHTFANLEHAAKLCAASGDTAHVERVKSLADAAAASVIKDYSHDSYSQRGARETAERIKGIVA
jgi:hypothetical protein